MPMDPYTQHEHDAAVMVGTLWLIATAVIATAFVLAAAAATVL